MATQGFLNRSLCVQRNSVSDEYYMRSESAIFENDLANTAVEVCCWSDLDLEGFREKDVQDLAAASTPVALQNDGTVTADDQATSLDCSNEHCKGVLETQRAPRFSVLHLDLAQLKTFIEATHNYFRVFYIRHQNSRSRLEISKDQFQALATHCRVFPQFAEFLIDFKFKIKETEIGPPRIRFHPIQSPLLDGSACRAFECAYIVRFIEFTNRFGKPPWSLRQFAVYNKSSQGRHSTWILAGSSKRTESCFYDFFQSTDNPLACNPFELHVIFLDLAIASWRPYLNYLHDDLAELSTRASLTSIEKDDSPRSSYTVDVQDYQSLKGLEDQATDLVFCLDSTLDTVTTFADMYRRHFCGPTQRSERRQYLAEHCYEGDEVFMLLGEKMKDVQYSRKKAEALLTKAKNTRALVSSLLERMNGYNLDQQMSALQSLEKQGQEENAMMRQLAEKSSHDSTSVRILTIITLIYLPCTVVSSFYSTQFVERTESPAGGSSMQYADNAWLFFAVSVPLTLFTITVWYAWANSRRIYNAILVKQKEARDKLHVHVQAFEMRNRTATLPC